MGTILSVFSILGYLVLWNAFMNLIYRFIANWVLGGVILYFVGALVGSFVLAYLIMNATARFFYKLKLARPLTQLNQGIIRIQNQDLDFELKPAASDELGKLIQAFEKMRRALQTALKTAWQLTEDQKQVNAAFAHDLRTPLTILQGNVELLELQSDQLDTAALKDIKQQLDRINAFIERMSRLSTIQNLHLTPSITSINLLTKTLHREAEQLKTDKTIQWQTTISDANQTVSISKSAMLEIFDNQLTNAFRFAKKAVTINLIIEKNSLTIKVCNDGRPLQPAELKNAMLPHFSGNKSGNHLGIGLYICSQLCKQHHGHFTIKNQSPNVGVCTIAKLAYL
ncbi:Signal transduction histidine kinase [Lentilactobacillus farraginis DSM 18382 = JCM 14108]|nr:Signal transduction histidine kinase [Lentilactobacillus farraginis DSM 18382 = JCM 14108]